ncbi:hypothetical protein T11_1478, partial [Trichinella zimbabwensis]
LAPKRKSATEPPSVAAPPRTHQNLEEARSLLSEQKIIRRNCWR